MNRWIFTHHYCGTGWTHALVKRLASGLGLTLATQSSFPAARGDGNEALAQVFRELQSACSADLAYDANARAICLQIIDQRQPDYRAVHLVRDPRDVLVAACQAHREQDAPLGRNELAEHRERLRALPLHEALLAELDCAAFALDAIAGWTYAHRRTKTIRWEHLCAEPERTVAALAGWLELPLDDRGAIELCADLPFRSQGRGQGQGSAGVQARLAQPGLWKSCFGPEVKRAFKERYGEALIAAGYEIDFDW